MKAGLKPKKFFHDIIPVPKKDMEKLRKELQARKKTRASIKKTGPFDAVGGNSKLKSRVNQIWGSSSQQNVENQILHQNRSPSLLEKSAEDALKKSYYQQENYFRKKRFKTLVKEFLVIALKIVIAALIFYNALSLYYQKEGIKEKLYNLALISKTRFALAAESLADFDREGTSKEIEKAGLALLEIKKELYSQGQYSYILADHPMINDEVKVGQNILELGLLLKESNEDINQLIDALMEESSEVDLSQKIAISEEKVVKLDERIKRADVLLTNNEDIKKYLGEENSDKISSLIGETKTEVAKAKKILNVAPLIIGGISNRYLLLFTNNAEMRPVGGFPGNYGVINFELGNLKSIQVNDIYYLDWLKKNRTEIIEEKIEAGLDPRVEIDLPKDLYLGSTSMDEISKLGYWKLFSSNWNIDFRKNAQRAQFLFEDLYQQRDIDGVILLTPNTIEDILDVVGTIKMDNYDTELSSENFRQIIEFKVEFDNEFRKGDRTKNPKQILSDFGPILLEKISQADLPEKIKIFEALLSNLSKKEILLYHERDAVQDVISNLGYGGEIINTQGDFLEIAHSNINAMKNGLDIQTTIDLKSKVNDLGFAQNELQLTIINKNEEERTLHEIEKSYFEIIVPEGSMLREAKVEGEDLKSEVDYFNESGKTVFGFFLIIKPLEAKNVIIKYQAPLSDYKDKGYSLLLCKQPGAQDIEFGGEIMIEESSGDFRTHFLRETINRDKKIQF